MILQFVFSTTTNLGETLLSPLVMCGPHGLKFRKPIELRLPHKGASNDSMAFSLKSSDSPVGKLSQLLWKIFYSVKRHNSLLKYILHWLFFPFEKFCIDFILSKCLLDEWIHPFHNSIATDKTRFYTKFFTWFYSLEINW